MLDFLIYIFFMLFLASSRSMSEKMQTMFEIGIGDTSILSCIPKFTPDMYQTVSNKLHL